ncbi:MAG: peptidyl-prolyl cis-trans isomerase [Candidatus Omnitrophica bacterium]|nr:peptidyl-prolyl cis-trans isomerase [Candidatus Omnitrophota bacterium]
MENKSAQEINEIMATYEQKGVNQLIEDRLILAAANEKGLEIRPEVVDRRLKGIKDRYSNEDAFVAALSAQGMSITDLKNKIINQMKAHYIVDIEVKQKIFVNPQDVTKYYEAHQDDLTRKTKYNLQSIYISFDKGKDDARQRAMEAHRRLLAGEDFEKLRQEYSEFPSVGAVEEGQMVPAVEKVVFGLKLDEVSGPVEVEAGVYIFKAIGISPGHKASLVEARNDIYNRLYDEIFQKKFKEWVDQLSKKSYVEVR